MDGIIRLLLGGAARKGRTNARAREPKQTRARAKQAAPAQNKPEKEPLLENLKSIKSIKSHKPYISLLNKHLFKGKKSMNNLQWIHDNIDKIEDFTLKRYVNNETLGHRFATLYVIYRDLFPERKDLYDKYVKLSSIRLQFKMRYFS